PDEYRRRDRRHLCGARLRAAALPRSVRAVALGRRHGACLGGKPLGEAQQGTDSATSAVGLYGAAAAVGGHRITKIGSSAMKRYPSRRAVCATAGAAALCVSLPRRGLAQAWPQRPLRLIVPSPAGGGTDAISRQLAERIGQNSGFTLVIENRAGAGG